MIVYGDLERLEVSSEVKASVAEALRKTERTPPGIDRHAALVGTFIRAAELVQGIADAEFERRGSDARSSSQAAGAALLLKMAEAVDRSWTSGFCATTDMRPLLTALADIVADGLIRTRTGEGYAHYGLYPESYLEAARGSGLAENTCVIGIRSIGVGLGALVAAALGTAPALSLRPVGHPFERQIRADPDILEGKTADSSVHFAIVDEGPGLSGSSFAGVARWLQNHGVASDRIHFFPSHEEPPGPVATTETRAIWDCTQCHPARPDAMVDAGLRFWLEQKIGAIDGALRDVPERRPPDNRFARRKLIARTSDGTWLIKFVGIGDIGEQKHRDAVAIAEAGFGPKVAALCYGFLVQEWAEGTPLGPPGFDRNNFLAILGAYIAFRATHLGPAGPGASLDELRAMAVHNVSQALGGEAGAALHHRLAKLEAFEGRLHPVRTDNRLHAWEWLVTEDGILKLDAVDHCEAHDLIGCQDIAWDVAGAMAEHDLTVAETANLCATVPQVDRELVAALLPCYLAFQLGLWSTATPASAEAEALAASYAGKLSRYLTED